MAAQRPEQGKQTRRLRHHRSQVRRIQRTPSRRRALAELAILNEISRAISSQLHIDDVLETIYQQASRLIDTSNFYIALHDVERDQITFPLALEGGQRQRWPPRRWRDGLTELLLQTKEPLLFSSAAEMERYRPSIRYGRASRSWLGVPILLSGAALGTICVQSMEQDNAFDQRDLSLMSTIAAHAAVAIAKARIFDDIGTALSNRVAELEALEAVVRDLNGTLELRDVLRRLVDRTVAVTGADAGLVSLIDPASGKLTVMASKGYSETLAESYQSIEITQGIVGRVARTGQASFVENVQVDPDYLAARQETQCQLTVPLMRGGALLGVLALESDRDPQSTFSDARLSFIRQIAEHAALAISNARAFAEALQQQRQLQQRSAQLAEVLRVSRVLTANLQLDALAQEVVQAVRTSLGFNCALLSLLVPEERAMRRWASTGLPDHEWQRLRGELVPVSTYTILMQEQFRISRSYFIPHSSAASTAVWAPIERHFYSYTPNLGERQERQAHEWHPGDSLFVPLRDSEGTLLGILSVDDPVDQLVPSLASIQVLEIFANQAAVALENAQHYAVSQHLAHTDGLTGLHNQRHFSLAIEQEIRQSTRYRWPLSLLLIDLDYFKSYNDRFGHLEGNLLLQELARILLQSVRQADIVARVGGEEFAVILPQTDLEGALELARRINVNVAAYQFEHERATVSIGVAVQAPGMDAAALYDAADQALYRAKHGGRNAVAT